MIAQKVNINFTPCPHTNVQIDTQIAKLELQIGRLELQLATMQEPAPVETEQQTQGCAVTVTSSPLTNKHECFFTVESSCVIFTSRSTVLERPCWLDDPFPITLTDTYTLVFYSKQPKVQKERTI